jgi:hypothetical protein
VPAEGVREGAVRSAGTDLSAGAELSAGPSPASDDDDAEHPATPATPASSRIAATELNRRRINVRVLESR